MIDLQALAIRVGLVLAFGAACWFGGCTSERHKNQVAAATADGAATAKQKGLTDEFDQIRTRKDGAVLRLADQLRRDLASVQHRPARLPEPVRTATCRGSTGSELSREDAGFLIGEAARADGIAEDLAEARQQISALRRACGA